MHLCADERASEFGSFKWRVLTGSMKKETKRTLNIHSMHNKYIKLFVVNVKTEVPHWTVWTVKTEVLHSLSPSHTLFFGCILRRDSFVEYTTERMQTLSILSMLRHELSSSLCENNTFFSQNKYGIVSTFNTYECARSSYTHSLIERPRIESVMQKYKMPFYLWTKFGLTDGFMFVPLALWFLHYILYTVFSVHLLPTTWNVR